VSRLNTAPVNEATTDGAIRATGAELKVVAEPRGAGAPRSLEGRSVAIAAVFVLVTVLAAAYWLSGPGMNSRWLRAFRVLSVMDSRCRPFAKNSDRVGQSGRQSPATEVASGHRRGAAQERCEPFEIDRPRPARAFSAVPIEQRAILYEEDPADTERQALYWRGHLAHREHLGGVGRAG